MAKSLLDAIGREKAYGLMQEAINASIASKMVSSSLERVAKPSRQAGVAMKQAIAARAVVKVQGEWEVLDSRSHTLTPLLARQKSGSKSATLLSRTVVLE